MNKRRISHNSNVPAAAWMRACGLAVAVMMLAAGPASASYTGTIGINWGTASTIAQVEQAFDTALQAKGLDVNVLIPYDPSQTLSKSIGATVGSTYTAENNVVGTVSSNGTVTSYNLSNYAGGTFLQNISEPVNGQVATSAFTIEFVDKTTGKAASIDLRDISFDYEIFPNIDCTALSTGDCGAYKNGQYSNLPSLNVTESYINSSGATVPSAMIFQRYGVVPGTKFNNQQGSYKDPDNPLKTCPAGGTSTQQDCGGGGEAVVTTSTATTKNYHGSTSGEAGYTSGTPGYVTDHSGTSGKVTLTNNDTKVASNTSKELAPQLLGTSGNVSLTVGKGVKSLTFNDWPATIAISQISFEVPEPNSWSLIISGLVLLGLFSRSKAMRSASKRA